MACGDGAGAATRPGGCRVSKRTVDLRKINEGLDEIGAMVRSSPELAERTRAMLAGDLPCPALEGAPMPTRMVYTPLRVPEDLVNRAEALAPEIHRLGLLTVGGRATKATVFRYAIAIGLEFLEGKLGVPDAESKAKPKRRGA